MDQEKEQRKVKVPCKKRQSSTVLYTSENVIIKNNWQHFITFMFVISMSVRLSVCKSVWILPFLFIKLI
jgi:hypothetical protein